MASDRAFFGVSALVFAFSAAVTIVWCGSMSAIGMPMPGGWTMSMAWMRMPGQTWPSAADHSSPCDRDDGGEIACVVGAVLGRYRRASRLRARHARRLTAPLAAVLLLGHVRIADTLWAFTGGIRDADSRIGRRTTAPESC